MLRTAEEIIKSKYKFYDPEIIHKDVELNGKQISELINEARKEAIEECAANATLLLTENTGSIQCDKAKILSLINELK